jgi:hypothetical protein
MGVALAVNSTDSVPVRNSTRWKESSMPFQTISGATGTICTRDGLYKATDRRAQYVEMYFVGEAFRNFPGGKGTKSTTWYLVTGTSTASVSSTDGTGTVTSSGDGGFTSVVVDPGTA